MVYVVAAYSITFGVLLIYGILLQHRARVARARLAIGRAPRVRSAAGAASPGDATLGAGAAADAPRSGGLEGERGFNLGAALLAPFWIWAHGQPRVGVALLVAVAALAAAQASGLRLAVLLLAPLVLGASLFFGVVGNRIAATRHADGDPVALAQSQLPWALAGAVLYTVVLPWAWQLWLAPS